MSFAIFSKCEGEDREIVNISHRLLAWGFGGGFVTVIGFCFWFGFNLSKFNSSLEQIASVKTEQKEQADRQNSLDKKFEIFMALAAERDKQQVESDREFLTTVQNINTSVSGLREAIYSLKSTIVIIDDKVKKLDSRAGLERYKTGEDIAGRHQ